VKGTYRGDLRSTTSSAHHSCGCVNVLLLCLLQELRQQHSLLPLLLLLRHVICLLKLLQMRRQGAKLQFKHASTCLLLLLLLVIDRCRCHYACHLLLLA
jgi:hypothetical protein